VTRHFLRDDDLRPAELTEVLDLAAELKAAPYSAKPLAGPQTVAIIFDKPTLRTQASFVAGVAELGGNPMVVDGNLAQIGTRESIADVARVLGRQASVIVWRTYDQSRIEEMAAYAGVPVLNALTDQFHPCQTLADLLTIREHKGALAGLRITFVGDAACNMGHSYLLSGAAAGMHVNVACPEGFEPDPEIFKRAAEIADSTGGSVHLDRDPVDAVQSADVVITDTWVSMGREDEAAERVRIFTPYQVNAELLGHASAEAIVLHCLPAYRGNEITAEVLDGRQSVIWDEAENRRHAQKAIITWLLRNQV
jgi:ornithine carbamoyltransferase